MGDFIVQVKVWKCYFLRKCHRKCHLGHARDVMPHNFLQNWWKHSFLSWGTCRVIADLNLLSRSIFWGAGVLLGSLQHYTLNLLICHNSRTSYELLYFFSVIGMVPIGLSFVLIIYIFISQKHKVSNIYNNKHNKNTNTYYISTLVYIVSTTDSIKTRILLKLAYKSLEQILNRSRNVQSSDVYTYIV